jgi:VanZ family protein
MKLLKYYNKTILLTILILFLSLANFESVGPQFRFRYEDKVIHFLMYFGITIVYLFEHYIESGHVNNKSFAINLYPLLLGGLIEIIQARFTSTRSGEWFDFFADLFGIIIANIFFLIIKDKKLFIRIIKFPFP